ncbi:hypothetical protein RF11_03909 [Thelohanellus kitauei]|uniref:Uncharacterized protein n=1 Tax=Thelohanellus kitauei TaxID=669202 RepID=A0A0C2JNQ7_THEKT|nr:hypothetical protein RF11_03909 [Thelohanellus kitauei]
MAERTTPKHVTTVEVVEQKPKELKILMRKICELTEIVDKLSIEESDVMHIQKTKPRCDLLQKRHLDRNYRNNGADIYVKPHNKVLSVPAESPRGDFIVEDVESGQNNQGYY